MADEEVWMEFAKEALGKLLIAKSETLSVIGLKTIASEAVEIADEVLAEFKRRHDKGVFRK